MQIRWTDKLTSTSGDTGNTDQVLGQNSAD